MQDPNLPLGFTWMESKVTDLAVATAAQHLSLPEGLAHVTADFKGEEVSMRSRAWQTETFRVIRETVLYYPGKLRSFNFVIYPYNHFDAPIFATDFIALAGKLRIGLIDAMPLFPDEEGYRQEWILPFMPLQQKATGLSKQYDRKLNWSLKFTGQAACLATEVTEGDIPKICLLWERYLNRYLQKCKGLMPTTPERQAKIDAWHRQYNHEHLAVENKRNPYMTYFGEAFGRRYNEEFLFSESFGL